MRFERKKMLLCTSVIALISLILISQSKATFLPKEIRVLMSGVSRSELAHRHHSGGAGTFFFFFSAIRISLLRHTSWLFLAFTCLINFY